MTLSEIQDQISLDVDINPTAPSTTNTEYIRRRKVINRFEREWASRRNYFWEALLKETELSTTAEQTYVTLPSDLNGNRLHLSKDGYIKIGSEYYRMVTRAEFENKIYGEKTCYISGNAPSGFQLNIYPTPEDVKTVYLRYFSSYLAVEADSDEVEVLTNADDETKCPNPNYLIYATIAELFKMDDESAKGLDYERRAEDVMEDMLDNENQGSYQQGFYIQSESELNGFDGIGRWR